MHMFGLLFMNILAILLFDSTLVSILLAFIVFGMDFLYFKRFIKYVRSKQFMEIYLSKTKFAGFILSIVIIVLCTMFAYDQYCCPESRNVSLQLNRTTVMQDDFFNMKYVSHILPRDIKEGLLQVYSILDQSISIVAKVRNLDITEKQLKQSEHDLQLLLEQKQKAVVEMNQRIKSLQYKFTALMWLVLLQKLLWYWKDIKLSYHHLKICYLKKRLGVQ